MFEAQFEGTATGKQTSMARIIFPPEMDEDGDPPFATERLWADEGADGLFKIDDIPVYARRLASGDVVSVEDIGGALHFRDVVQLSSNSTIRFVSFDKSCIDTFDMGLEANGCEWDRDRGLMAIDVTSAAHHRELMNLIAACGGEASLDYEEAALRFDEADPG